MNDDRTDKFVAAILAGAMNTGKALSCDHYMTAYKQLLPMVRDHSKADEEAQKKAIRGSHGDPHSS